MNSLDLKAIDIYGDICAGLGDIHYPVGYSNFIFDLDLNLDPRSFSQPFRDMHTSHEYLR